MSKNAAIDIFLRVRPTKKPFSGLHLVDDTNKVEFHIPKDQTQGYVNNQKEDYKYAFNGMFGMDKKQEDIFEGVARDVVDSVLEGFNGTVFAYGQTGSGKTYTMTGGAERYVDRGIIPRTLSYIFQRAANKSETYYKISVSYIEIYNNEGYDLLDENHTTKNLSDLNKVIPREREDGTLILSGLSVHKAENEEQALNLLFIGDTNRVVSETPKNDASTRSHCIFIIQIEGEKVGSEGKKTQSRLYLVDLSGSERVGKTDVQGLLLKEARFINLSLHHLEHVIICLNKKSKGENIHIPYRNSLMTMILRDSLGGNSKTRMVATISAERDDIDESICTCRFAQRVALIQNSLLKNEAVDPALIIQKLKKENEELRAEIAFLKGGQGKTSLEQSDVEECRRIVEDFVSNPDPGAKIILKDMLMINECFYYFKHRLNDMSKKYDKNAASMSTKKVLQDGLDMKAGDGKMISMEQYNNTNEEIKRLKLLVQQRDNEIVILLNLINKQKESGSNESAYVPVVGGAANTSVIMGEESEKSKQYKPILFPKLGEAGTVEESKYEQSPHTTPQKVNYKAEISRPLDIVQTKLRGEESSYKDASTMNNTLALTRNDLENMLISPLTLTNEQLKDRAACFELFRKSYRKNQALEENKEILKAKMAEAKQLGVMINNSRNEISRIKNQIEDLRRERAKQGLMNNENEVIRHPDEDRLTDHIERHKTAYRDNYEKLKNLKSEIENIQTLMERNSQKMQKDFDRWLDVILNQSNIVPVNATSHISPMKESVKSNLNSSGYSSASKSKNTTLDPAVQKNLEAFYKARDEIYNHSQ